MCFMFIDHCGNVGIRPANTNFLLHAISTARTTMNPAYRPERGYVSIPVLGAVGASYGTNGIAVDKFYLSEEWRDRYVHG